MVTQRVSNGSGTYCVPLQPSQETWRVRLRSIVWRGEDIRKFDQGWSWSRKPAAAPGGRVAVARLSDLVAFAYSFTSRSRPLGRGYDYGLSLVSTSALRGAALDLLAREWRSACPDLVVEPGAWVGAQAACLHTERARVCKTGQRRVSGYINLAKHHASRPWRSSRSRRPSW